MDQVDIWFVNLGIQITNHQKGITIGGFTIAYYGLMIALGVLLGLALACFIAKKSGQDPEIYMDVALYGVIFGILGARIYYVVFNWDIYKDNLLQIFNLRAGGLAIYGGIIAAVITVYVIARRRKVPFPRLLDTAGYGLITGQIVGRWGNFFNCEAFGGYTNNLFAMRLNVDLVNDYMISEELLENEIVVNGITYIQVHPTFLYEGAWNFCVLLFLLWMRKRVHFEGEIFCLYLLGYGLGRFWIEGLRTDSLMLFGTGIAVSQLLSAALVVAMVGVLVYQRRRRKRKQVAQEDDQ
ncbi:MAG: prolipoprotein diacylglyceryl transferase [Lachnospiraceae bacterium]|nr:prolipoprotein diacylglyceryl transferase [Lachnospiraceae bacterium]